MTIQEIVEKIYENWYNNQCVDIVVDGAAIKGRIVKVEWVNTGIVNTLQIKLESGAEYYIDRKGFRYLLQFRKNDCGTILNTFKVKRQSAQGNAKKKCNELANVFVGSLF